MTNHLNGSWEDFEQWIRGTIGSDFQWLVRPLDTLVNREMVVDMIKQDTDRNDGVFPESNGFIERV